jgi:hypothetical protein
VWASRGISFGSSAAQIASAFGQRVRNRQPDGGFCGLGTSPLTPAGALVGQESAEKRTHGGEAHAAGPHLVEKRHQFGLDQTEEGDQPLKRAGRNHRGRETGRVRKTGESADLALLAQLLERRLQPLVHLRHGGQTRRLATNVVDDVLVDTALQVLDDRDSLGVEIA